MGEDMSKPYYDPLAYNATQRVFTVPYDLSITEWAILWEDEERYLLGNGYSVTLFDRSATFKTYEEAAARAVNDLSEKSAECSQRTAELMNQMTARITPKPTAEQAK